MRSSPFADRPAVAPSSPSALDAQGIESRTSPKRNPKSQESGAQHLAFLQIRLLKPIQLRPSLNAIRVLHRRLGGEVSRTIEQHRSGLTRINRQRRQRPTAGGEYEGLFKAFRRLV